MNKMWLLLICIIISCGCNAQTESAQTGTTSMDPVTIVTAATELLKTIKTTSSVTISQPYTLPGTFIYVDNSAEYSYGSVLKHKVDILLKLWINSLTESNKNLLSSYKQDITNLYKDYDYQVIGDPFGKTKYEASFSDGMGNIAMMIVQFKPSADINIMRWEKYVFRSYFKPAPAFVVVTKSKCDVLKCKRHDRIEWLPATVTADHYNTMVTLMFDAMNKFSQRNGVPESM